MLSDAEVNNLETRSTVSSYFKVLSRYAKARSLIFIFPWATFISALIAANGYPDPLVTGMAVGASYLIMLAIYSYNDVVDLNVDRINAPNRPLVSGKVNQKDLTRLVWILNGSALALTALINLQTLAIASLLVVLGIVYSHPKTHYRDIFPLKTVLTATGAALVSLLGGSALGNFSPYVIFAALIFFAFECILAVLGDVHDLRGDRTAGRRTFPILFGLKPTIVMMMLFSASIALTTVMVSSLIHMNNIGLMVIIAASSTSIALIRGLMYNYGNRTYVQNTRYAMRFVHVLLQLGLFVGIFI